MNIINGFTIPLRRKAPEPLAVFAVQPEDIGAELEIYASGFVEIERAKLAERLKEIDADIISLEAGMREMADTLAQKRAIRAGIEANLDALDGYDAADDSRRSYEAAIEAKRARGDQHYPTKAAAE